MSLYVEIQSQQIPVVSDCTQYLYMYTRKCLTIYLKNIAFVLALAFRSDFLYFKDFTDKISIKFSDKNYTSGGITPGSMFYMLSF